jgi:tellurite resistance protein
MTTRGELAPLFTDLALSADDANAIVAALHDVAESDGKHAEEIEMIQGFVQMLDADLGADKPTNLPAMTPQKLAQALTDDTVKKVAVQCAVLLAWADGALSEKERAKIVDYATALGFSKQAYEEIEKSITGWVKSGDLEPLF